MYYNILCIAKRDNRDTGSATSSKAWVTNALNLCVLLYFLSTLCPIFRRRLALDKYTVCLLTNVLYTSELYIGNVFLGPSTHLEKDMLPLVSREKAHYIQFVPNMLYMITLISHLRPGLRRKATGGPLIWVREL